MKYFTKIPRNLIIVASLILLFQGCTVLDQVNQMANLAKCEFRIASVTNLTLSGVSVQNIHGLSDLSITDAQRLFRGITGSTFPLVFILNVEAKNPNTASAGMNRLDWILFIDDIQMTSGSIPQAVTIPANNGVANIPMQLNLDLKQVLRGKSTDAIINFGMNLAGIGNKPTRFMIKLKPTIMIGQSQVVYPGYITVKTDFVSN
ncbi:MAG: hypothetical protein NTX61_09735 [Bacteroidetes bacterium]|nr:hypothetical protein [Bacteroidota bacterium]